MHYNTHTLSNDVRVIHIPDNMPISYIGVAIDAGTRDEMEHEGGMAHFVEHMLFKGTKNRRSHHIINWLESVGGQLDAYTTKEETYIFATVPTEYIDRALNLLSDLVFNSIFPQSEMDKERDVVLDEIQSYNDSPSELIYDEFEELLYPNDAIGRNILGTEESLNKIDSETMQAFVNRCYSLDKIVVFALGAVPFDKFLHRVERYFGGGLYFPDSFSVVSNNSSSSPQQPSPQRSMPSGYTPQCITRKKDTYQTHCIIGNRTPKMNTEERLKLLLLNNILGGPNMSSRLNMAIRERNGLCYSIESNLTTYTDTGVWAIYFGCDPRNLAKAQRICMQQLEILRSTPLTGSQLQKAKLQLRGQVLISNQNKENVILSTSKVFLHHGKIHSDDYLLEKIDAFTAADLQAMANQIFDPSRITTLIFK
ncbi:MAG: pitrilysin family protein [bacterium]